MISPFVLSNLKVTNATLKDGENYRKSRVNLRQNRENLRSGDVWYVGFEVLKGLNGSISMNRNDCSYFSFGLL